LKVVESGIPDDYFYLYASLLFRFFLVFVLFSLCTGRGTARVNWHR